MTYYTVKWVVELYSIFVSVTKRENKCQNLLEKHYNPKIISYRLKLKTTPN